MRSKTDESLVYVVDMSIGTCDCILGRDGSPCWHQFILWANGFATSGNFLPKFDKFERKRFAEIAIGESLESSFDDSIHVEMGNHGDDIQSCISQYLSNKSDEKEVDIFAKFTLMFFISCRRKQQ